MRSVATTALTVSSDLAREKRHSSLGNRLSKLLKWFAIRGENKKAIAKTKILIGKTTMRIQRRIGRKIAIYVKQLMLYPIYVTKS